MRRLSVQLLRESPAPALRACAPVAQMHSPVAKRLFQVSAILRALMPLWQPCLAPLAPSLVPVAPLARTPFARAHPPLTPISWLRHPCAVSVCSAHPKPRPETTSPRSAHPRFLPPTPVRTYAPPHFSTHPQVAFLACWAEIDAHSRASLAASLEAAFCSASTPPEILCALP